MGFYTGTFLASPSDTLTLDLEDARLSEKAEAGVDEEDDLECIGVTSIKSKF